MKNNRPLVLIILDGWGYRKETEANAIAAARKPNWDHLCKEYPNTLISGSGRCVGLPEGQMGNSEVGHLTMGAGRIVHQDLTRIDVAIEDGTFYNNPTLIAAMELARNQNKKVHVLGLLSPGGVHSHERHFHALIKMAAKEKVPSLNIHAFLDGRDTPPQSAMASLLALENQCNQLKCGQIVSLIGRYYAMDRDKRWDRVEKAYDLLTQGIADYHFASVKAGLSAAYDRQETDEFVKATSIHSDGEKPVTIDDGDVVIFMNFRADRARELTQCLTDPNFTAFTRKKVPALGMFICLAEYDARFNLPVAFPSIPLMHLFPECIANAGFKQLRIAETEKYAHVTFFFNGGQETPVQGEERLLIPSPKVATYDLQPEMSAYPLTEQLTAAMQKDQYDVIVCNFANPDMVGHTGNYAATVKAIETIDQCLGKIYATAQKIGAEILITADHGNAEKMFNTSTNQPHTAHTNDPVPFIYIGRNAKICNKEGKLSDIAPTMLYLLGLPQPPEMTGKPLVKLV